MCPLAQSNGHGAPWLADEFVPGEAAVIDDVIVIPTCAEAGSHLGILNVSQPRRALVEVIEKMVGAAGIEPATPPV